jgi:hypothetical protein
MECEHDYKLTPSRKKKGNFYYRCLKCDHAISLSDACEHEYEIINKGFKWCIKCNHVVPLRSVKIKIPTEHINTGHDLVLRKSSPDRKEHSQYKLHRHCVLRMCQREITVKDIEKTILNGKLVLIMGAEFVNYVFNNMVVRVNIGSKYIETCYRSLSQ